MTRPMLACDWVEGKVKFPLLGQPKIDGVRAMNLDGRLTGRSGKAHENVHTTNFFSQSAFFGFDGEMAAESEIHPALCRLTSSALSTITGEPWIMWHVFDYITPATIHLPYADRHAIMVDKVLHMENLDFSLHLKIVWHDLLNTHEEIKDMHAYHMEKNYEGTILRNPKGIYKQGRSTAIECGLLRIKDWVEEEAIVLRIIEGQQNTNEATLDPHGMTERSTHMANMVPNGMVGALECLDIKSGKEITVAAGKMTHDERKDYFNNPEKIVNKAIKYKTFLKGVKDKPRFPTFQSVRMKSDMS